MCLHCCIFCWNYHISSWWYLCLEKSLFFNLVDNCLSCAGTTKHAWKQCIATLCPPERNMSYTDGERTTAGYPQPFKRAVTAVNCGLRGTRVVCTGRKTLPASEHSRRDWPPAETEVAGSPLGSSRLLTRRQLVPPSGAEYYYRFSFVLASIS